MPLSSIVSRCVPLPVTHASAADSSASPRFGLRSVQWGGRWRGAAEVSGAAGLRSGRHTLPLGKCVPPRPPSALATVCCVTPLSSVYPNVFHSACSVTNYKAQLERCILWAAHRHWSVLPQLRLFAGGSVAWPIFPLQLLISAPAFSLVVSTSPFFFAHVFDQVIFQSWLSHSTVSQMIVPVGEEEAAHHNARAGVTSNGEIGVPEPGPTSEGGTIPWTPFFPHPLVFITFLLYPSNPLSVFLRCLLFY